MSDKRFFAFGCSYTEWIWPTWADFVGVNFDQYFNLAKSGSCNTLISERVIESDALYNFNPETDFVAVGLTGFGRFSYYTDNHWNTHGDILLFVEGHPEKAKWIAHNIYNFKWAAYKSWIAARTIKSFLTSKGIKHKIFMSLDQTHYLKESTTLGLGQEDVNRVKDFYSLLDFPISLQETRGKTEEVVPMFFLDGDEEGHPRMEEHYAFMSKCFPEFDTEKSRNMLQSQEKAFQWSDRRTQGHVFKTTWAQTYRSLPDSRHFGGVK